MLNSSYLHGFHLANRFGLNKYEYEAFLVAANLARYSKGKFTILRAQWINFLGGHHFSDSSSNGLFEFDIIKMNFDGNRQVCPVIRIGRKSIDMHHPSPLKFSQQTDNDRQLITTPPRLTALCLQQRKFRRDTERMIVQTQVELDTATISPEKHSNVNKYPRRDTERMIVQTQKELDTATISPEKHSNVNKYPHLTQLLGNQFDPSNSKTKDSIHEVLSEIIDILRPGVGKEVKVKNSGNHSWVSSLGVPATLSEKSFNKSKAWLETAIKISGNAIYIANHMCRYHRESVLAVLEKNAFYVSPPMSGTIFGALISELRITHKQEKVLRKHLQHHIGIHFCPTRRDVEILYDGHREVHVGSLSWDYDGAHKAENCSVVSNRYRQ